LVDRLAQQPPSSKPRSPEEREGERERRERGEN
jgi:hypothetical protein